MIDNERDLSLDHIVPRSRGGSDYLHNMQPAHRKCNEQKGNTVTGNDVTEVCEMSDDTLAQILERKKKCKSIKQKKRNVVHIKVWNLDNFNDGR